MRVMAWNVNGAFPPQGSKDKIRNQIDFIEEEADSPDILMLNEVTTNRRDLWREQLQKYLSYVDVVDTLDWASELRESNVPPHQDIGHSNGNLIAVHEESPVQDLRRRQPTITEGRWDGEQLKHWSTNFPEKILPAELELANTTVGLWAVRTVPGSMYGEEKIKILENTYNRIREAEHDTAIVAGDLNSPKAELPDGTTVPWGFDRESGLRERWIGAELDVLTGLAEEGIVDVFREVHGYGQVTTDDVSFQSKRFDHILASEALGPEDCYYDHDGLECSDHAPIVAELSI